MKGLIHRASFFALVELLERHYQPHARVGETGPAKDEVIRFRGEPSLTFPGRDIQTVREPAGTEIRAPKYEVVTNFLGLLGTVSPIPAFYSEQVLQHDDVESAPRALFDLFHHRLVSLFYRAGTKYRHQFGFRTDCSDPTSRRLLALSGLIFLSREALQIPPACLLRYTGLLYHRPRSASILESALTDFLRGVPVAVMQCIPRWVSLQRSQMMSLGRANGELGISGIIGARVRTCASAFRIDIGPMRYQRFIKFLPSSSEFVRVIHFVNLFLTDPLDYDVALSVFEEDIPAVRIGSQPQPAMGSRLGWTTWLIGQAKESRRPEARRMLVLAGRPRRRAA